MEWEREREWDAWRWLKKRDFGCGWGWGWAVFCGLEGLLVVVLLLSPRASFVAFSSSATSATCSCSSSVGTSSPAPMPRSRRPICDTMSQSSLSWAARASLSFSVILEPTAIVTRILSIRRSIAGSSFVVS